VSPPPARHAARRAGGSGSMSPRMAVGRLPARNKARAPPSAATTTSAAASSRLNNARSGRTPLATTMAVLPPVLPCIDTTQPPSLYYRWLSLLADVAQLAEHPFRKWAVVGSNPTIGSHSSNKQARQHG